ncbi:uncharacterized protein [Magallana gigas]|uniref:uncharacterized protein isoform X3 n=1 Tax=Magallana gigas TaxID=29159 RepID=UPI00333EA61E
MDTPSGPKAREDFNNNPNTYVELLPETKTDKNRNELSAFKEQDFHRQEPRHASDDNRVSTSSSSYESCRPYRTNVSCHTYVDIEECNRDMEIERCNSISTVATLPIDLPMPKRNEQKDMLDNSGKRQLQNTCIQEEAPMDMTPRIHYEMKVPDKSKAMKKYMVLFCIVLVFIVVSTVLAGYVGTKDVVGDIPSIVQHQVETMPGWTILGTLLNQTEIETLILNQSFANLVKKQQTLNKRFENLTNQIESDFSQFKNETQTNIESIPKRFMNETDFLAWKEEVKKDFNNTVHLLESDFSQFKNETQANIESIPKRFMNETDFLAWKEEVKKDFYTTVQLLVCVSNCTGRDNGDYQSCSTCHGYVSCSNEVLSDRPCQNGYPGKPLIWDDVQKRCDDHFRTCHPLHTFESKQRQLNTFD